MKFNGYWREIVVLGLNTVITLCNDTTGYIYTVSLRWAPQKESRLTFNSNLRLFTSVRSSKANAWYTNVSMLIFMIISYVSPALIFMGDGIPSYGLPAGYNTFMCGFPMVTLAIALLGQAGVASICLISSVNAPTWSSDPLETAAACVSLGTVHHNPDRCLRSVYDRDEASGPVSPMRRQWCAYKSHSEVRLVTWCMWIPVILVAVWAGAIAAVIHGYRD